MKKEELVKTLVETQVKLQVRGEMLTRPNDYFAGSCKSQSLRTEISGILPEHQFRSDAQITQNKYEQKGISQ